jgi:alkylation response protein AidB-like acyl-CoA dehydrogenase
VNPVATGADRDRGSLLTDYLLNRKVRLGRKLSGEQGNVDFSYPAEVEQFRSDLRDWLSENLTDELVAARRPSGRDDAAIEMLRAWSATMADAGWAAVSWPREYGGRGATVLEQLVYTEETTRARAPMPLNVIGLNNIAPAIMQYGTEDQKLTLLPRMMRADDIWCQGMSEPEAGSDLAALRTRAVRDGDDFVVNGQKIWTSLGHRADWCQLYVRTDPDAPKHKGISCLIVDMTLPGIDVRPLVTLNGDADFAEVFFHEVRVPAGALLGPLNAGWQVATTTLSHERAGAARLYAEMQVRLEELVDDIAAAQEGRAPGPLQDPVTLRRLAELALRIKYLEVLCQRSISATLHGGPEKVALGSASLAKTVWGEIGQDMAALGYDVLGTRGAGAPWANYRLTSRSLTIAGGTSQINKNITAQRVLGLPRK